MNDHFYRVDEVHGLYVDGVLLDDDDELVFLSLWGRETAIREMEGKLSVDETGGGLRSLTLIPTTESDHSDGRRRTLRGQIANADDLHKVIGQMPQQSVFGRLVNMWLYQGVVIEPDRANRQAWLLFQKDKPMTEDARTARIWAAVKDTCNLPLLDHWQVPILGVFRGEGWIRDVEGIGVDAVFLDLGDDRVEEVVSSMIGRSLVLDPAEQAGFRDQQAVDGVDRTDSELLAELAGSPRSNSLEDIFGPVISMYSRQQAIDDGVLVDVSEVGKEAGFKWPVALSRAVWEDCVAWSEEDNERKVTGNDEEGRLWDVIWMASRAIAASKDDGVVLRYEIYRVPREGGGHKPRLTTLKLMVGPGDNGEPVVTIMLPNED